MESTTISLMGFVVSSVILGGSSILKNRYAKINMPAGGEGGGGGGDGRRTIANIPWSFHLLTQNKEEETFTVSFWDQSFHKMLVQLELGDLILLRSLRPSKFDLQTVIFGIEADCTVMSRLTPNPVPATLQPTRELENEHFEQVKSLVEWSRANSLIRLFRMSAITDGFAGIPQTPPIPAAPPRNVHSVHGYLQNLSVHGNVARIQAAETEICHTCLVDSDYLRRELDIVIAAPLRPLQEYRMSQRLDLFAKVARTYHIEELPAQHDENGFPLPIMYRLVSISAGDT